MSRPCELRQVLHADAPAPGPGEVPDLFGRFVGAWDIQWRGTDRDGRPSTMLGDLHVGWILDGSCVQDVWKVPRDGPAPEGLRPFHGTTLRFYDRRIDGWRSTWIDPLNGRVRRFIGRPVGAEIVLEGLDDDPAERWTFRDIAPDSFRWTAEISTDGRRTWRPDEEMTVRRRPAP